MNYRTKRGVRRDKIKGLVICWLLLAIARSQIHKRGETARINIDRALAVG
ncbi:MAG: hypothetical protein AAF652_05385 [Cyanobacteria bacterium P01_C01_bin.72]